MRHQVLLLVICSMALAIVFGGCGEVEESFLVVENRSNVTVVSIYVSAEDDASWGQDQLMFDVLRPGELVTIPIESGTYDVKVVSRYGQEFVFETFISDGLTTTITVR